MQIKSLLSLLASTGAVAKRSCGTPKPTVEQILVAQNFQISAENSSRLDAAVAAINVKIYWHVVASSNSVSGGYLTQATLNKQLAVLNTDYAASGVSFVQAGADWTINAGYAGDTQEMAMKKALRNGTYADLNVYFVPDTQDLGYAYFPSDITSTTSNAFYQDGVVIQSASVPGGSLAAYNLGRTATHEVGHWLGLYHVFEGYSCTGNGDYVSDTAFTKQEGYGCAPASDSCPSQAGTDPVTNYMNYSEDSCMTNFTDGQDARIVSLWNQFRKAHQT
ncbi:zincin [Dothidotthia symphoricarpi CBS 119687]|uniref:Zincin n=1 Tax=Dothidotthia symphoricarpi CBS 119687 TaxID=1392245 RepID=A0A6A6AJF1_9PLEO|nr:zincin [Dothidotthia symphoricarpi CBS 119687]KAF2132102.1 zincin [Dothidotthia symphoricarpi CBS 119687]